MGARALQVGQRGQADITPQKRDSDGKWKRAQPRQRPDRWRARCYYRGSDGTLRELSRVAATRAEAEAALETAFTDSGPSDVPITPAMRFTDAGTVWLEHIGLPASKLSPRTVSDYGRTFHRCVDAPASAVRGLSLAEANNPQRLRAFLQQVADGHGTSSAKVTRSVLTGILQFAVDNGVQPANAIRQVPNVQARGARPKPGRGGTARDTTRAFTRVERDRIVTYAYTLAAATDLAPQTYRKRRTVADLLAFLAGTGVRISEARQVKWEYIDLGKARVEVFGTKSRTAHRMLTLPGWLVERLASRLAFTGGTGLVFGAPHFTDSEHGPSGLAGQVEWEQSNCAKALASVLTEAGFGWATPHAFRRTVATLAHEGGAPLVAIADQLGHANPTMTARVYLGRDPFGERASVAQYL